MDARARAQRVSVQVRTEVPDGHDGFLPDTWATRHHRWSAQVIELSGRDLERAVQIDPRIAIEVRFAYWRAYREDLDGGRTRLLYHPTSQSADDRTFEIVTPPIEAGYHDEIQVLCREAA